MKTFSLPQSSAIISPNLDVRQNPLIVENLEADSDLSEIEVLKVVDNSKESSETSKPRLGYIQEKKPQTVKHHETSSRSQSTNLETASRTNNRKRNISKTKVVIPS